MSSSEAVWHLSQTALLWNKQQSPKQILPLIKYIKSFSYLIPPLFSPIPTRFVVIFSTIGIVSLSWFFILLKSNIKDLPFASIVSIVTNIFESDLNFRAYEISDIDIL